MQDSRFFATWIVVVLFLVPHPASARGQRPQALTPDQQSARDIFRELVEINTTHGVGTTAAAIAVQRRLLNGGFTADEIQMLGPKPGKENVLVRLRGRNAAEKPVLFLAHLDVVEAKKDDWSPEFDPFKFTERDGFFYGRGTIDIKQEAASLLANIIRLRREAFVPERDLVVALTADEEGGGDANGVEWLLRNHRPLVDSAYVINTDVGGGHIEHGQKVRYTVQTSEKQYLDLELEVKNNGGHSSLPVKDNAIYRLSEALAKLARFEFPVQLNDTTRTFFQRMSAHEKGQTALDMRAVAEGKEAAAAAQRLSAALPLYNSMMRNTCVATMVEAGHAPNALPQSARALVNCRLLPGARPEDIPRTLITVIGDDQVSLRAMNQPQASPASPLVPEVLGAIETLAGGIWPGVPVVPVMDPWSSDSVYFRQAGIPVYGAPGAFYEIDPSRAHGKDERVGRDDFFDGLQFMYGLMKRLGTPR